MPTAIPYIVAGATVISTISSVNQARAQARAASNEEEIAKTQGLIEERNLRHQQQVVLAKQRAITGASGLEPSGSPLETMLDTARQSELDILTSRYGAKVKAQMAKDWGKIASGQIPEIILSGAKEVAHDGLMSGWFGEKAANQRSSLKFARTQTLYDT